ncbi:O-antigen ligase family protein [Thiolapillus sp.]
MEQTATERRAGLQNTLTGGNHAGLRSAPVDQPASASFILLTIYVAMIFIRPQEWIPSMTGWPIIPVLVLSAFMFWLFSANKALNAPQFYLLGALMLFSPLTVALAGEGLSATMETIVELAPLYLTFLLIASTSLSRSRIHVMMWLMVAGAVLMSVHGIQQKLTGAGWTGEVPILGRMRYIGIFNDPNDVGLSLVTALPMAMHLMRTSRHLLVRLLLLISVGLILWGIKLTDSRGTILALAAILGVYSWRRFGIFRTLIMGMMALPAMFFLSSRLDTISPGEESAYGRVDAWYEGIQMLIDNPVFGVGFGLFGDHNLLTAHNSYILVLAELGIPGYFLWFSFFGSCIMMMYLLQKPRRKIKPAWQVITENRLQGNRQGLEFAADEELPAKDDLAPEDRAIARVLFLSFVGFATASFFLSRSYSMQLFLLCGMAVAHYQGTRLRNPREKAYGFFEHFWFWAFTSGASVIFLYFTVHLLLSFV